MNEINPNTRLEAFCDAVFAIALTLLIIEIKLPHDVSIQSTRDLWQVLAHMLPSIFAFILSFAIILITWVNHHEMLKLVNKSSVPFIYANGMLLLSVVMVPFPTALLGEFILGNHAAPAVILYNAVLTVQSISWVLICRVILKNGFSRNEISEKTMHRNLKFGCFAFILYSLCTLAAFWFPLMVAIITTISWIFWLIWGLKIKNE